MFLLAVCFSIRSTAAQESEPNKIISVDSITYTTTLYFEVSQGVWVEPYEYDNARALLKWVRENESSTINVKGWCDPSGTQKFNNILSYKRARTIHNYLTQRGIDSKRITFEGCGIDHQSDYAKARRADVVVIDRITIEEPEPKEQIATIVEPVEEAEEEAIVEEPAPAAPQSPPLNITPRTNLLYWLAGWMNIGAEWRPNDSPLGVVINAGYSFFGDTTWNHNLGGWFVAPELRYYLPRNDQWFVGLEFLVGGFNYKLTDTGYQGTFIAGGVMGGYKFTLSKNFDMDFTVGLGYGNRSYDSYYHDDPTETNPYIDKNISKNAIMPIQAGVNLIWKIK